MICILITFLLTLSVVPPAYLQYASFVPFISEQQKRWIYAGYAACFTAETLALLVVSLGGQWAYSLVMFKWLYTVLWIPYFIWAVIIIRPYFFRHIYVFALRSVFMIMLHTLVYYLFYVLIQMGIFPGRESPALFPLELFLYTIGYLLCLPVLIRYFNEVFRNDHVLSMRGYWKYICILPCLIFAEAAFFTTQRVPEVLHVEMLVPRIIITCAALLIAFSVKAGLEQVDAVYLAYERKDALTAQIRSNQNYVQSLNEAQKLMEVFWKKQREYLQRLTDLVSHGEYEPALKLIEQIGCKLEQTKR